VPAADGDVVEEDVAARKSPGNGDGLIQQERGSSVTPAFDDKQRRVVEQLLSPHLGLGSAGRSFALVVQVDGKNRGVMTAAVIGAL